MIPEQRVRRKRESVRDSPEKASWKKVKGTDRQKGGTFHVAGTVGIGNNQVWVKACLDRGTLGNH